MNIKKMLDIIGVTRGIKLTFDENLRNSLRHDFHEDVSISLWNTYLFLITNLEEFHFRNDVSRVRKLEWIGKIMYSQLTALKL